MAPPPFQRRASQDTFFFEAFWKIEKLFWIRSSRKIIAKFAAGFSYLVYKPCVRFRTSPIIHHFFNLIEIARKSLLERVWRPFRSPEKMKVYQSVRDQQTPPRHHPDHPKPPRQTSPSRPAFLQAGEGRGRRRRNSILSRLAEDSAFEPMGLLAADTKPGSGASRDHLRCGSSSSEGGQGDVPQGRGHGDAGPRLLVEHISQLSEPACRFCQYPAPHLDCSKINIYSGGSHQAT